MNDTPLETAPIILDRRLHLGDTEYQVTVFPTDDRRLDLCIVSSDSDGHVISEISGGITPADLSTLTEVLTSTLAGLIAMTRQPAAGVPPAPTPAETPDHPADRDHPTRRDHRDRPPNQGTRWTTEDDTRLLTSFRTGTTPNDLATAFGRTPSGIRARLEHLGELPPSGRWPSTHATPPAVPPTPTPTSTPTATPDGTP
ncbi:hypothetical protein [Actinoplanes sp. GCM10030250]|uniref:hypothetical protein n=1 Tax=Actinoplanes sp. GCM10030250 TaxID=3273376 RepID=UPI00360DFBAA